MTIQNTILALLAILAFGLLAWFVFGKPVQPPVTEQPAPEVLSFEDCVAAGYPVQESYPRQCATPDGRTYAEELPAPEIVYVNASADMIKVSNPTPGAVTGKQFTVMGQARGNWYFEASFPVEVRGKDGNIIATGVAQAQGDWMTENFVPFKVDITVPDSYIGAATLTLKKDNPSGMPENDASISFPFTIEY